MADTSNLYSTVKNIMGVDHVFGYIPPHGKKLLANTSYTVAGDLVSRIVTKFGGGRRQFTSLERDLLRGRIVIENTPRPIFFDAAAPALLATPTTAITAATGGTTTWTGTTGNYYFWYTWTNAYGETSVGTSVIASAFTLTNGTTQGKVTVPALPAAATGVNVYASTTNSSAGAQLLVSSAAGGAINLPANFASTTAVPSSNTATIPAPVLAPLVNPIGGGSTGGSLVAGSYYLKYTYTNANGETTASPETGPFTVAAGNIPSVSIAPAPPGATGINVYLTAPGGTGSVAGSGVGSGSGLEALYASYPTPTPVLPSNLATYLQPATANNPESPNSLVLLSAAMSLTATQAPPGSNTATINSPTFTPLVTVLPSGVPAPGSPASNIAPYLAPGLQGDVIYGALQQGGALQAGNYYVKFTFTTANGETPVSPESNQFTVTAGQIPVVQLVPPLRRPEGVYPGLFPAGVTGANIYLTVAGGASGTEVQYTTGVTSAFALLNKPTGLQNPPLVNNAIGHAIRTIRVNADTLGTLDPSWGTYLGAQ